MKHKKTTQNSGFKIPKGYFNTFEDRLHTELKLSSIKNDNTFKTPKDYLDNFKIDTSLLKTEPKVVSIFSKRKLYLATSIAATIVLLITLSLNRTKVSINDLDNDTLENFVLNETTSQDFAFLLEDIIINDTDFIDIDSENVDLYINDIELEDLITE